MTKQSMNLKGNIENLYYGILIFINKILHISYQKLQQNISIFILCITEKENNLGLKVSHEVLHFYI